MGLESRLLEVPGAAAKVLKAATDAFVVGPAISFFVPAAKQQQVFEKVLPDNQRSLFGTEQYSGLGVIYELVIGTGLIAAGAATAYPDYGALSFMASMGGAALDLHALVRGAYVTQNTVNDSGAHFNPCAAIPIEICYGLFRAGRELVRHTSSIF